MYAYIQYRRLVKQIEAADRDDHVRTPSPDSLQSKEGQRIRLVQFAPSDPANPREWSYRYRIACTVVIWQLVYVSGWASSADSTSHLITAQTFHVSQIAESLVTAMFLFGIAIGAVVSGPCSEILGRLLTYLSTFALFLVWVMACALSPNFGARIVFRFFAGLCASASMSIYGGSLADMFDKSELALIWPFFATAPLLAPTTSPVVSGWIAQYLGWPWVDWVTLIISGTSFITAVLFLPETFSPVILSVKARTLRQVTGDNSYQSEYDQGDKLSEKLTANLRRLFFFIFREPTTVLFGLYLTLLFVLIYGFLGGFDYVFTATYGFSLGADYSTFAAIAVGILFGLTYVVFMNRFPCVIHHRGVTQLEQFLLPAIGAAPILTISLFWIGWTNRADISPWSDIVACGLFGFALMGIFAPVFHYVLNAYGTISASAMASITFMRYLACGGMVIATDPMYKTLTVKWALTLLGCVAGLLTPIPWVFWRYGHVIREKSRWTGM